MSAVIQAIVASGFAARFRHRMRPCVLTAFGLAVAVMTLAATGMAQVSPSEATPSDAGSGIEAPAPPDTVSEEACNQVRDLSGVLRRADSQLGTRRMPFRRSMADHKEAPPDTTLAPYFFVPEAETETDPLPLKETRAEVNIAGVIAQVRVFQVFENAGTVPLEAIYVFPASTRAAVHGMKMRIGQRTIEAKIDRRAEARRQYEEAKEEGKRASLLEQERANVFTMNVANIMPGDRIEVELVYSELLVPEDAVYEFVYPTVVGPRYGGGADPGTDRWISNPYLREGEPEPYTFGIKLRLRTAIPIKELSSPSHKISVFYSSKSDAEVTLEKPGGGNRDFVLRYRLAGDQIETGVLLYEGEKDSTFLVLVEPPERPISVRIPPREYIFLVDVSGSMRGFPLRTAKILMERLLSSLRPSDRLNVVLFAGASYVMRPQGSVEATERNIREAVELIERQTGGGGTELMEGLNTAYSIPAPEAKGARTVVVVTDGYVGVEAQAFRFIRERLNDANLFAFGIGSSVNRDLIERMARAGMGEPFVVLRAEKAHEQAEKFRRIIDTPVLTNVKATFSGLDAYDVVPERIPDVMARRPIMVIGKYHRDKVGEILVSGFTGEDAYVERIRVTDWLAREENAPIRILWARTWVQLLEDERYLLPESKELEETITNLGLCYSLLTRFTSFVAIDTEVVNEQGALKTVRQPLPLPEGVPESALPEAGQAAMAMTARKSPAFAPTQPPMPGVAPLPPMPTSAEEAKKEESVVETEKQPEPVPEAEVPQIELVFAPQNLSDPAALEEAIRKRIEAAVKACASAGAELEFMLTVDQNGMVIGAVVVKSSGNGDLDLCVIRDLPGILTATRPEGAEYGTMRVTLTITYNTTLHTNT